MALRRVELMAQLSDRKCLRWSHDLVEEESSRLARGVALNRPDYAFNDDGRWFPPVTGIADGLKSLTEKELKTTIAELKFFATTAGGY